MCTKLCHGRATDCVSTKLCGGYVQIPGSPEYPLICTPRPPTCDPLLQDCTTSTDACYPTQQGNLCIPAGAVPVGGACDGTAGTLCTKGGLCITLGLQDGGSDQSCRKLCNTDGGMPNCTTGSCGQLTNSPFGACI